MLGILHMSNTGVIGMPFTSRNGGLMPFFCLSLGLIGVAFLIWVIQRLTGNSDKKFWG